MKKLLIVCVLASIAAIACAQTGGRQPTFLTKYLTTPQLTAVTNEFKKGHTQTAINHLQRFVRRLPKAKQDEFNQDFRSWVQANAKAVAADSPVTADLSFLTKEQRDSINRKLLNCEKLAAMRELRDYIERLPRSRRETVLRAFRRTLPNLDFLTQEQWQAIQAKTDAGDDDGAKVLLAEYIRSLTPVDQQKAARELLKAQKRSHTDLCSLSDTQRQHVLTKLNEGDKRGAKQALDRFIAHNEASKKPAN